MRKAALLEIDSLRLLRSARRALVLIALCGLAPALAGCGLFSRSPEPRPPEARPAKRRTVLSTEWDDRRAGEEGEQQVLAELGRLQDEALQAYVQEVGAQIGRAHV